MSLPTIRGTAKLLTDPKVGPTKTGGTWTNAVLKFVSWRKVDNEWQEGDGVVAAVIAFDDVAAQLAGFRKGDPIEIHGTASVGLWKDQAQLKVTVGGCRRPVKNGGSTAGEDRRVVPDARRRPGPAPVTDLAARRRSATAQLVRAHQHNPRFGGDPGTAA